MSEHDPSRGGQGPPFPTRGDQEALASILERESLVRAAGWAVLTAPPEIGLLISLTARLRGELDSLSEVAERLEDAQQRGAS